VACAQALVTTILIVALVWIASSLVALTIMALAYGQGYKHGLQAQRLDGSSRGTLPRPRKSAPGELAPFVRGQRRAAREHLQ
jgi:hypothetical protein